MCETAIELQEKITNHKRKQLDDVMEQIFSPEQTSYVIYRGEVIDLSELRKEKTYGNA